MRKTQTLLDYFEQLFNSMPVHMMTLSGKNLVCFNQAFKNFIKTIANNHIVIFGCVISIAWIASSFVLASGLASINTRNTISVTGTAERVVDSDAAKWNFTITRQATQDSYTYVMRDISEQTKVVTNFLLKKGVPEKGITVQPVTSSVVCQSQNQVMYDGSGRQQCAGAFTYNVVQTIIVQGNDVEMIKDLSLSAPNALANIDVQIQTVSVDFFYTKLATIRAELLEEAAKNAKDRAQSIAKSTGNKIGDVKDASQGVFQVTQKNSTDVSDYGSYDTQTIEKKVTALVRASFEVK
jgi:hypothetical protein